MSSPQTHRDSKVERRQLSSACLRLSICIAVLKQAILARMPRGGSPRRTVNKAAWIRIVAVRRAGIMFYTSGLLSGIRNYILDCHTPSYQAKPSSTFSRICPVR